MSGKFIIFKERSKYRFNIVDDAGAVVFKGAIASTKDGIARKINLIQGWGDSFAEHLQAMTGPDGSYLLRGEEHTSREGEQGRVGDAAPLGFTDTFPDEKGATEARSAIVAIAKDASVVDETGE